MSAPPDGAGAFQEATGRELEDAASPHRRRYLDYQFELIARSCGDSVLEIGAGLGDFADRFGDRLDRLVVTDVDPGCVSGLAERFAGRARVQARRLDLDDPAGLDLPRVSTVVAINVLEHIVDDSSALQAMAGLARPGGNVVLWVPGYMQLYGDFDRRVGHVRRYTPDTLRATIEAAGLTPADVRPVNLVGAAAWWLAVRVGGAGSPRPALLALYDRILVPLTRAVERRVTPPFGQSVLAVATVPAAG